ncbi:interferon a3-like [Chaetodon trifascialis]|uniref:interferon a3-like n=1 Tax=Chaetodon trifascialis TaxID=109706 RepID=UPI003993A7B6
MFSWTGLLFVLCGALTPALCCDWLSHYRRLSNASQTLVLVMGGELTKDRSPVSFPYKLYESMYKAEVESQLVFIRDSLELISDLYHHDNRSSANWDTDKSEELLMNVHRQTEELSGCVSTNRRADSKLGKYYRRLKRSTLSRTGGSTASWELIRKATKLHLEQLDLLVVFMNRRRSTSTQRQH